MEDPSMSLLAAVEGLYLESSVYKCEFRAHSSIL